MIEHTFRTLQQNELEAVTNSEASDFWTTLWSFSLECLSHNVIRLICHRAFFLSTMKLLYFFCSLTVKTLTLYCFCTVAFALFCSEKHDRITRGPWLWQRSTWLEVMGDMPLILKHPFKFYIALGKNMEKQCRWTAEHNGGTQHELIIALGINKSLWLSKQSGKRDFQSLPSK